jgi:hypothetical protein
MLRRYEVDSADLEQGPVVIFFSGLVEFWSDIVLVLQLEPQYLLSM